MGAWVSVRAGNLVVARRPYEMEVFSSHPNMCSPTPYEYTGECRLGVIGRNLDYQIAAFSRYSTLSFHPDQVGDLIYNGEASRVFRGDWANGLQGDFAYRGLAQHTIRAG
jgi:hypothetical protein